MKIGILGGGQLGRMLALAGYPLGLEFIFYDQDPQVCAASLGTLVVGDYDDKSKLTEFAQQVDIVTVEFENIPLAALEHVSQQVTVVPNLRAIKAAQDRLHEKHLFTLLGVPTPLYYQVDNVEALADALSTHKDNLIVKSRRLGYDGKGQRILSMPSQVAGIWTALGAVPLIAEQYMRFRREVSLLAVRNRLGEVAYYPLTENRHEQGVLRSSRVTIDDPLQRLAEDYAQRVLTELDYVGVLAFEFFDCDGELVANEIAPRVHNSGHWTIEGGCSSQFENHLRAILDWPLGSTRTRGSCVMYNVIGEMPDPVGLLKTPGVHLHDYGKQPRPGRKLGHITLCEATEMQATIEKILVGCCD